jgi:hypothetical protein
MSDASDPFRQEWPAGVGLPAVSNAGHCIWCQRELGTAEGGMGAPVPAVCDACAAVLSADNREPLGSFIEKIDAPVLVLAGTGQVELANAKARVFLGKSAPAIGGHLAGEVIECIWASEPEGCGGTVHCSGCTLRRSVHHTHATGEPLNAHSCHDVRTPGGVRTLWLEFSTERAGKLVLLKVSQVGTERRV